MHSIELLPYEIKALDKLCTHYKLSASDILTQASSILYELIASNKSIECHNPIDYVAALNINLGELSFYLNKCHDIIATLITKADIFRENILSTMSIENNYQKECIAENYTNILSDIDIFTREILQEHHPRQKDKSLTKVEFYPSESHINETMKAIAPEHINGLAKNTNVAVYNYEHLVYCQVSMLIQLDRVGLLCKGEALNLRDDLCNTRVAFAKLSNEIIKIYIKLNLRLARLNTYFNSTNNNIYYNDTEHDNANTKL